MRNSLIFILRYVLAQKSDEVRTEGIYPRKPLSSLEDALAFISRFIQFYNCQRPHMSIGYKTPSEAHLEHGEQKKMWRNKIYESTSTDCRK